MTVKLTDFGIARASAQTRLTQVGSVVGTAAYLAPEQARGEEATPASDVFALGVVLYQLLTGRLPWEGSTLAELATRRENERPLPPTSYDPEVPETLSRAVLRSLEGDPAARYSSARELSRALDAGLAGREPAPPSDELPTNMLGTTATEATRRIERDPATPVAPYPVPPRRAPAPAPAPRPVATPAPQRPKRSAASRFWRAVGVLAPDRRPGGGDRRRRAAAHRRRAADRHRAADQGRHRGPGPVAQGLHRGEHAVNISRHVLRSRPNTLSAATPRTRYAAPASGRAGLTPDAAHGGAAPSSRPPDTRHNGPHGSPRARRRRGAPGR